MIFLLLNFYILISHYIFLSRSGVQFFRDKIIGVSITFSCQIILTQTVLGTLGLLSANYLTILNAIISTVLIVISFYNKKENKPLLIIEDFKTLYSFFKSILSPYNVFLTILTIIASTWIILSAFLFPPRGVDDLTYHLTAIYEYIQNQEIFLLPLYYRMHFVLPMNAEFLFMWPLNYFKSTNSIGLIQYTYSLIGMIVIYALARSLSLKRNISYFSSQLFFLTPLVLLQSGSAYIDIITSVFVFLSIYVLIRFKQTENNSYLYLFAISTGLMTGMKYTMFVHSILLFLFFIPLLRKIGRKQILLFSSIFFICCCYWYIRNLAFFGNPLYPFLSSEWTLITQDEGKNVLMLLLEFYEKIKLLFLDDIGIGSLHGGYGIFFWGIAIPSWIYFLVISIINKTKDRFTRLLIWSQLFVVIIILLSLPLKTFEVQVRFNLFAIGIGAIAVGALLEFYKDFKFYKVILIILCSLFSVLSMTQLSTSALPTYAVDIPIEDKIRQNDYSKFRYLRISCKNNSMMYLFETLDYITRYNKGLNCYFAMSSYDFVAPLYGSNLQNRVWNFDRDNEDLPDAFFFLETNKSKIKYIKRKFTSEEIMYNRNYELIDRSDYSYFFLNKKFLEGDSEILKSLLKHYEKYFENEIESAKLLLPYIEEDIPIVTPHYIGFGLKYLNYTKKINNKIFTIPVGKEKEFTDYLNLQNIYTINNSIDNYTRSLRYKLIYDNEIIALIHNTLDENKQTNNGK